MSTVHFHGGQMMMQLTRTHGGQAQIHYIHGVLHHDIHRELHHYIHRGLHRDIHGELHHYIHRGLHRDIHRELHHYIHRELHQDIHRELHHVSAHIHSAFPCLTIE